MGQRTLAAALLVLLPLAAAAQERVPCRCRANGQSYALGGVALINTPGAPHCAVCVMSANVPSWQALEKGCPPVAAGPPARPKAPFG
ncbi:MAG: hypothetical protein KDG89_04585 [Geminicoccaceae bacterium]|nr:hypothetical protein [Geminicoccaceae bacterium]